MKKLLFLLSFVAVMFTHAQTGSSYTFPTIAGDSLVNQDTVFKRITLTGGYAQFGIQASIKKGTGTLDGKLYLYQSINGSGFVLTDSSQFSALPSLSAAITGNVGGMTYTAQITKTEPPGTAYIVAVTQGGSLTSSPVKVSYTARRHD